MSHVIDVTRADTLTDTPPSDRDADTGPHCRCDPGAAHNHTFQPTNPIRSTESPRGKIPNSGDSRSNSATIRHAIASGSGASGAAGNHRVTTIAGSGIPPCAGRVHRYTAPDVFPPHAASDNGGCGSRSLHHASTRALQ